MGCDFDFLIKTTIARRSKCFNETVIENRSVYLTHRFPCRHNSIVAILTLEVTGIPELSDNREFPWPKPGFVEPTRAFVFEVRIPDDVKNVVFFVVLTFRHSMQLSVFENDKCEYLFPEGLFTERLTSLESALRERNSMTHLPVSVFYEVPRASEDAPMEASQGVILSLMPEEDSTSDPHMSGSGFGIVKIEFDSGEWVEDFSPWDLCMADLSIPRPHLSDDDQKLVLEKLNVQCREPSVAQHFNMPVDTVRYCDYERMVEIEMCLMVVKRRLREDYYASKFSVIQDLRLIRDNCIKYNGAEHELAAIASTMCEEFETGILTEEEACFLKESDSLTLSWDVQSESRRVPTIRINLRQRTNRVSAQNHRANQEATSSRSQERLRSQSSLENLPAPELPTIRITRRGRVNSEQARAPGRQTRSMDSASASQQQSATQRRSLRSRGLAPNLESLSRLNSDSPSRNNSIRSASASMARQQRPVRLSSRRDAVDPSHNESDIEEGLTQRDALSSLRMTTRSTRADAQAREEKSEEDNSSGEVNQAKACSIPCRRSSRRTSAQRQLEEDSYHSDHDAHDESKCDDSDHESADSTPDVHHSSDGSDADAPRRSSRRAAKRQHTKPSPRTKDSTRIAHADKSGNRKSRRKRTRAPVSYEEPSDFEPEEDDAGEESEEEMSHTRSRRPKVDSYAELPSDFDDEEDLSEGDRKPRSSQRKRKGKTSCCCCQEWEYTILTEYDCM